MRYTITFPVSTATAECSFSDLCGMKTFFRSNMSPCRLNNLFLIYIQKQKTDKLDLNANEFVSVNKRRINVLENLNNCICIVMVCRYSLLAFMYVYFIQTSYKIIME